MGQTQTPEVASYVGDRAMNEEDEPIIRSDFRNVSDDALDKHFDSVVRFATFGTEDNQSKSAYDINNVVRFGPILNALSAERHARSANKQFATMKWLTITAVLVAVIAAFISVNQSPTILISNQMTEGQRVEIERARAERARRAYR